MPIQLNRGKHQHNVPRGTEQLLEEVLQRAGYSMNEQWIVTFGPRVTGTATMSRFRVKGHSDAWKSVEVRIKPGGNDTTNICWIFPPQGVTTQELEQRLRNAQDAPAIEKTEREIEQNPEKNKDGREMTNKPSGQPSALHGFTRNKENVNVLLLAISENATQPVPIRIIRETVRELFDAPNANDRSIGKVLATLDHQKLIIAERDPGKNILNVSLTDTGRERIQLQIRASSRLKKVTETSGESPPPPPPPQDRISAATEQLEQEAAELEIKLRAEEEKASLTRRAYEKIQAALKALKG